LKANSRSNSAKTRSMPSALLANEAKIDVFAVFREPDQP
jgi:hypothetical protein